MKKFFCLRWRRPKVFVNSEQEEVKSIVSTARDYFSNDFPNPKRIGCPPKDSFRKLIDKKKLPDEILRSHLLACSECFEEYRSFLRQAKLSDSEKTYSFSFPLKPILLSGLAIFLFVFGSMLWFWNTGSKEIETAENKNRSVLESVNDKNLTAADAEKAESVAPTSVENSDLNNKNSAEKANRGNKSAKPLNVKESAPLLAKNEVDINMNDSGVWRSNADESNQKTIVLLAGKTQLRVKLPKKYPAGLYEVFIADEFGKKLTEQKKVPARNGNLSVKIDLKAIDGSPKRLCLAPDGEIPDCVLIKIVQ